MKAAKKKKASKLPDCFAALIRTAYFPIELPPAFTTKYFAQFCKSNYAALKVEQKNLVGRTTNYETFTAPRGVSGRRNLALVHPLSQAALSLLITQHRAQIRSLIAGSKTSLYRTEEKISEQKAFVGLDFRKWEALKARTYSEYQFVLQAVAHIRIYDCVCLPCLFADPVPFACHDQGCSGSCRAD